MNNIILLHQNHIQHYRCSIYNYLSIYLKKNGYKLKIISQGIEAENPFDINFFQKTINLNLRDIIKEIRVYKPKAVILFVNLKNLYLFPLIFYLKLRGIRVIYWGHGIDLQDKNNAFKNAAYRFEHYVCDGILLYADHLKKYIIPKHHKRVFIANNTLNTSIYDNISVEKNAIKAKYGISTSKNIICMGRIQKRKRIDDLINAFKKLKTKDVGLILAGPDPDGLLNNVDYKSIYKLGQVYGDDAIKLLSACDLYCLPGHVGLSIVDAFYCGLPLVTEDVDHAPEIMYFKNRENGFMVKKGDVNSLSGKLDLLLSNVELRQAFAKAAKRIIKDDGHINIMCQGFVNVLNFVLYTQKDNVLYRLLRDNIFKS